ncbi:hypothetical protein N7G274_010647 [Stereocaulon virgatum]|uniref:Required for respiratory growth protein 7, mitochondrial n=1 Tax=Stereocaulon virgatum TaxID=373712 RepID=A0ABR3ZVH2_9LECA
MLLQRSLTRRYLRKATRHTSTLAHPQPTSSSQVHNDLHSFHDHARSTNLSSTSTVHVGTSYEYLCAHTLPRLGFKNIVRTGGRSDRGIDLLGHWQIPASQFSASLTRSIPVIVQCKALSRKPGPELIRELEGALSDPPVGWRGEETVGVLCAKRVATAGVRDAVRRCGRGVVWVMVEDLDEGLDAVQGEGQGVDGERVCNVRERRGGRVKQILWNKRVREMVGESVGAGVKYLPEVRGRVVETEICLMVDGVVWLPEAGGGGDGERG